MNVYQRASFVTCHTLYKHSISGLNDVSLCNSELSCASVSKRVFVQNLSNENEFDLHENEPAGVTHFHMNAFARRLVLTGGTT